MGLTSGLRKHGWLLLILAFIAPILFVWTGSHQIGELGSDAPDYMIMARYYAAPITADAADRAFAAVSRFPPLYPMLLALCGASEDLLRVHLLTTSCLIAGLIVLSLWLRQEGLPGPQAALVALLFAMLPNSWMMGLRPQSEYPYLLLSMLALLLLTQHEKSRQADTLYTAALVIAAAALTRTIGVTLLLPLAVVAIRSRGARGWLAVAVAVAPVLIWHSLHKAKLGYDMSLVVTYRQHPLTALIQRVPPLFGSCWTALKHGFVPTSMPPILANLLALLCALPAAWRLLRLRRDAVYLCAYGPILLIWPFPEEAERLLWPVLPILLAQPLLMILESRTGESASRNLSAASACLGASILLLALPRIALASDRFRTADDWGLPGARGYEGWYNPDLSYSLDRVNGQIGTLEALQEIPKFVPETDCVAAARPNFVTYAGRRRSVFPPLNSIPDPYFMQVLRHSGCHYVFMYAGTGTQFPVAFHPLQRLPTPVDMLNDHRRADPPPGDGVMICLLARID